MNTATAVLLMAMALGSRVVYALAENSRQVQSRKAWFQPGEADWIYLVLAIPVLGDLASAILAVAWWATPVSRMPIRCPCCGRGDREASERGGAA